MSATNSTSAVIRIDHYVTNVTITDELRDLGPYQGHRRHAAVQHMSDRVRKDIWLRIGVIVFAGSACLALVGCGDGDDDAAGTTTTSESTTTSTATTSTESTTTESTTTTEPAGLSVEVYFGSGDGSDCAQVEAFPRNVSENDDPVQAAFSALVGGPTTDETAAGAFSFFSSATADVISSITLSDGLLKVDFGDDLPSLIPNASTSCGSESLLAQLNGTAFQFESVERARYLVAGSCDGFANWLQRDCFDAGRNGQQLDVAVNERAGGSGCTPATSDGLPDGLWFGFVDTAEDGRMSFDLACWFTGPAAVVAAAEDGEESPPPNDYHIRNANDLVRDLAVASTTEVEWLPSTGDPATATTVPYATWVVERTNRAYQPGVWLTVLDGEVVIIQEQYVP